jgi:hypothetical protein
VRTARWIAVAVFLVAAACEDPGEAPPWPDGVSVGPEVICGDPTAGFDRLRREGPERGLDVDLAPMPNEGCVPLAGAVVAEDLDGDGDIDVLLQDVEGFPRVLGNDGQGRFSPHPHPFDSIASFGRRIYGHAAVDLDGDRLPEVVLYGPSLVLVAKNLGDLSFGPPEPIHDLPDPPWACIHGVAFGDADGDGDLDLFVPQADVLETRDSDWLFNPPGGGPDLLLLHEDDGWRQVAALAPAAGPNISLLATFTDRDGDGDFDVLAPSDRAFEYPGRVAFYRNDGAPALVDDAPSVGADLDVSGMGIATADFNHDGTLDYCLTDQFAQVRCLVSEPGGSRWIESGAALGLTAHPALHPGFEGQQWEAWSIELVDVDNDGWPDAAATAGCPSPPPPPEVSVRPDALWQGRDGGGEVVFDDRSAATGFDLGDNHYGLAVADFSGDGAPDLLVGSHSGPPVFWNNPCGDGAWLQVELVGPGGNPRALGARVTASWGDGRQEVQELQGPRGLGQSPSRLHFGLGDVDAVDRVEIRWPDGANTLVEGVPARRLLTVVHPDG